jgi:hypothetical protein
VLVASIRDSIDRGFSVFFAWLPHVLGFLAVLLIGYFVAKIVGGIVDRVTRRAGLDRVLHNQAGGTYIQRVIQRPSRLLGQIAFWAVWLTALSLAVSVLGVNALENFVAAIWAYLPNVLAAVAIFLVAGAIATGVAALVRRTLGETATGKIVATAAPILVMAIATFMILDQLKVAHNIVVITYAALMGAIALGAALAFGLGGRDVAREVLQGAYARSQESTAEFRNDLDAGLARAWRDAEVGGTSIGAERPATGAGTTTHLTPERQAPPPRPA